MEGFTLIEKFKTCKCDYCGKVISTGIFNLSKHWSECWGKDEWGQIEEALKEHELTKLNERKE